MKSRSSTVNHPSELNSLTSFRILRKPGRGRIHLSPTFDHPEKERWEADINRLYYACGCSTGAKGLMLMLLLGVAGSVTAYLLHSISLREAILLPIAAAIVGAVVGKLAGLASANGRLKRVVHTVQAHWKPVEKEGPVMICG